MKRLFCCIAFASAMLIVSSVSAQITFIGDTFNVAMSFSPASQASIENANPNVAFTFDGAGTPVSAGVSAFDPAVEIFVATTETVLGPQQVQVDITIVGLDAAGNLANPIGDGSLAADGTPFTIPWMFMGVFNAAGDTLDPTITGASTLADFQIDASFFGMFNTAGEGPGGGPGNIALAGAGFNGYEGFNLGSDISTLDMSTLSAAIWPTVGAEFAGWQASFIVSVPEPSSICLLGLGGMGLLLRRRRSV